MTQTVACRRKFPAWTGPAALAVLCLLSSSGCSHQPPGGSPAGSPGAQVPGVAASAGGADFQALSECLQRITQDVDRAPERRGYGVHVAAHLQSDPASPACVRKVVMNVNVYWCDDGCVDGPAETPTRDEDLLLLRPFADTLDTLDLQHTEITDAGLKTLAELTALESLNLSGTAIHGAGLVHLATLRRLEHLDLSDTQIEPGHLQALGALPSLRTVRIPPPAITDEVLAVLGRLPGLRVLALGKSSISDRGLEYLAALHSLESLDLSGTQITDQGLVHLAGLTQLTRLGLSQTQITGLGLSHLGRLTRLEQLDLSDTAVDDAGLSRLAGLKQLQSLQLLGTRVRGSGLTDLRGCRALGQVSLPPIPAGAVASVNSVKSWQRLTLTLADSDERPPAHAAKELTINSMPELTLLEITSRERLERIRVADCPRLSAVVVTHDVADQAGAALQLGNLPNLRAVRVSGTFREFAGQAEWERIQNLTVCGALTSSAVRALDSCRALERLELKLTGTTGEPIPIAELAQLPRVQYAQLELATGEASWVLRLVGKMPALEKLYLRGRDLTARDLAPLANCRKLTEIYVHGINDSGEPLAFLDSLPDLDQCLVLGCPRVGKVRLTAESGVRRFYFKYGQLDELEIDGARNLTEVYLGHKAFGYNDDDARLPRLDIRRLAVHNAAELLYLMVDAQKSTIPVAEVTLGECPKLRSLTLHAPPQATPSARCRLTASGGFARLVVCRLYHLAADAESLARLGESR